MDVVAKRFRTVLMFGAPGSGKGTQGRILGNLPGFFHLSCGDVFRNLDSRSALGQTVLSHSSRGRLVPDELTVELWLAHLKHLVASKEYLPDEEILVLDGIPRNDHQARMMDDYVDVLVLICLDTEDQNALIERIHHRALREHRLDDLNDETIRTRFREYREETLSVLDHYPPDRVRHVDASRKPIEVLSDVVGVVRFASAEVTA